MTEEQKQAVLARDLNWCIRLGGNIYFLAKLFATDGNSFQFAAASMTGMTQQEYAEMMIKGIDETYYVEMSRAEAMANPDYDALIGRITSGQEKRRIVFLG